MAMLGLSNFFLLFYSPFYNFFVSAGWSEADSDEFCTAKRAPCPCMIADALVTMRGVPFGNREVSETDPESWFSNTCWYNTDSYLILLSGALLMLSYEQMSSDHYMSCHGIAHE
jgi:hypothetical protein